MKQAAMTSSAKPVPAFGVSEGQVRQTSISELLAKRVVARSQLSGVPTTATCAETCIHDGKRIHWIVEQ
jgi:hypothetical protein